MPEGGTPITPLVVQEGDPKDVCPLCGIHRENAGYLRESCGDGFAKDGCFINPLEAFRGRSGERG